MIPRLFRPRPGIPSPTRAAGWPASAALLLMALLAGCGDSTGPDRRPPYIAIIPVFSAGPETDLGREYTYRVEELSGTLHFDRRFRVGPTDTVIVSVSPATYRVTLSGVPPQCQLRDGAELFVVVPENSNTAVLRFVIECESLLRISTGTDGYDPDPSFIYRLVGPPGERTGILGGNDTVWLDDLEPGDWSVELAHVAPNCVVTSDGGRRRRFAIADRGGNRAEFRVVCSDPVRRPALVSFASSYHDGTSGFLFRATDPDRDIERYVWDITDCQGTSVLPRGEGTRVRRGLNAGRTQGQDTVLVLGAIELGLPDSALQGRCTSLRVVDEDGNTTPVAEEPIGNERPGPVPAVFNARIVTTASLSTSLQIADPGYIGVFLAALLRDGILFPPDGSPDLGVFNATGYLGLGIPNVPLGGGRPQYYDYYAVIGYLFDADGNFRRIQDDDLFR